MIPVFNRSQFSLEGKAIVLTSRSFSFFHCISYHFTLHNLNLVLFSFLSILRRNIHVILQGEIFLQSNSNLILLIYNVNEIILFHSERTMESLIIHKIINMIKEILFHF